MIISLISANVTATVIYPPQATYNWVMGDQLGSSTVSITDSRIYLVQKSAVGRVYTVTNAIDFSPYSYLEVSWRGYLTQWDTAFWDANETFGISGNAADDSFVTSLNHDGDGSMAFGSFNETEYLDVSTYDGSYFIKFGGELTKADDPFHYFYMYLYDVIAHNFTFTMPLNATSRTTTSATLRGKVTSSDTTSNTCGFWYGTSMPVDDTNNVTCSGTYSNGQTFSKSVGGLTSGEYYYVRSWAYDGYSFNVSSNYSYFITLPDAPTALTVTNTAANSVDLSWTNATVPVGTNLSVHIRWKNGTTPPSSITDGNLGANTSGNDSFTISNLPLEQTVAISAWTYINNSGSPTRSGWSASPATASSTTSGAIYNITVRYENESEQGNRPVNLREYGGHTNHTLYIYCSDATYQVRINNIGVWWTSNGITLVDDNTDDGKYRNFSISVNKTVDYFEFQWNSTTNTSMYCFRKIVPDNLSVVDDKYVLDFYVRTDLLVYPDYPYFINREGNGSLVKYTYSYLDNSGDFLDPDNDAFAIIYAFNSSGKKMIIHSEYFDQEQKVHPWLVYQNTYYQGVKCNIVTYDRIGLAPATSETDVTEIVIPESFESYYGFFDLIQLSYGWNDTISGIPGIYVHYQDTTFSTISVNCSVYGYYNNTLMDYEPVAISDNWFYYRDTENVDFNADYYVVINATLSGSVNQYYNGTYLHTFVVYSQSNYSVIGNDTLDDLIGDILGDSPFYSDDNPNIFVPWTYLILFGLCFVEMTTFGKLNAFLGSLAVGLTLILGGGMIVGISTLFSNYPFWQGASLAVIGVFMASISVIGLIGGAEK